MTWHDVKVASLQKMYAISGDLLLGDEATNDYIKAMPYAANEGMLRLCTVGQLLVKPLSIEQPLSQGKGFCRYDLKELAADYLSMAGGQVFYQNASAYGLFDGYFIEGGRFLLLPKEKPGTFTVYYAARPPVFSEETADTAPIPLSAEAAALLPLYIVSQLYKDDDFSAAVQARNEFEEGLAGLPAALDYAGAKEAFHCESGWW